MKKKLTIILLAIMSALLILSVVACNQATEYTVVFMDGDTEVYRRTVAENTAVNYTPPERADAEFAGWFTDKELTIPFNGKNGVTSDMTVYGKWKAYEYTVTFLGADGEILDTQTVTYGGFATAPEPPEIEGKNFVRWDRAFTNVTSDLTVTAIYSAFTGTAEFYYGGELLYSAEAEEGAVLFDASVAAGDELAKLLPAHLKFVSWYVDGESVDLDSFRMPAEDVRLVAKTGLAETLSFEKEYTTTVCPEVIYGKDTKFNVGANLIGTAYEAVEYIVEWIKDGEVVKTETPVFDYESGACIVTGSDAAKQPYSIPNFSLDRDVGVYSDVLSVRLRSVLKDPSQDVEGYVDEYIIPIRVTEGTFTVASNPINLTYNGTVQTIGASDMNVEEGDSVTFALGDESGETLSVREAGIYYAYFTVSRANYFDYSGSLEIKVTKAEASVKVTDAEVFYGDEVPASPAYETTGLFAGDELNAENALYSGLPATFGKAGESYTVSVSGLENDNYNVTYVSGTITVAKRPISVKISNTSIVYGDSVPQSYALELTEGTFAPGESFLNVPEPAYSYIGTVGSVPDAGEYRVMPDFSEYTSLNYEITPEIGVLTVEKRVLKAEVGTLDTEYGLTPSQSDYTLSFPSLSPEEAEGINVNVTFVPLNYDVKLAEAGSVFDVDAEIEYIAGAKQNYVFNVVYGKLRVQKANVEIRVIANDLVYGDAAPSAFNLLNVVWRNGENHNSAIATATDYYMGAPVGTYGARAMLAEGATLGNYELTFPMTSFEVTQKTLQITVTDASVQYGDEFTAPSCVVTGIVLGDTVDVTCSLPDDYSASSPAGTYTIEASYSVSDNYLVSYNPGTLTVQKRVVSVSLNERTELIAESYWEKSVTEAANLVEGHLFSATITLKATKSGVYSYEQGSELWEIATTVSDSASKDVTLNYEFDYALSVVVLSITIEHGFTDGEGNEITDWSVVYDGSSHTVVVSLKNPDGYTVEYSLDNESFVSEAPAFTNAGTYTVYYKITPQGGGDVQDGQFVFTVFKKQMSVVAENKSVTYGEAAGELKYAVDGYIGELPANAVQISTGYSAGADAGTYDILVSVDPGYTETNYTVTLSSAVLTVEKRSISVKVAPVEVYYGERAVYSVEVVSGSTASGDTLIAESEYVPGSGVGRYPVGIRSNSNYYITMIDEEEAFVTVLPRPLVISADDVSVEYSSSAPSYSVRYGGMGLYGSDTLNATATSDYNNSYKVGRYTISVEYTLNDNYSVTVNEGTLAVVSKQISVIWSNSLSFAYSGEVLSGTFCSASVTGVEPEYRFYLNGAETEFKNAGTYTVEVSYGENYRVLNATRVYTIMRGEYDYEPLTLYGTYHHAVTLADYADRIAEAGLSWLNPGETPTGGLNSYTAVVTDPNYKSQTVEVAIDISKAEIELDENVVTFTYDGKTHALTLISAQYTGGEKVPSGAFSFTLSESNFVSPGTYAVTVEVKDDPNYVMNVKTLFVKVAAVDLDGVKYTVEDALYHAVSGQTITLPSGVDVSFASGAAKGAYGGNSYYTLKAGVTMVLPSTQDAGGVGAPTYLTSKGSASTRYVDNNRNYINMRLTVPADVDFNVNGTVIVRGAMGYPDSSGNIYQGHTSGNHSQIINEGTITVSGGGTLDLRGYLKGGGTLYLNEGSNMYSPFVVRDFRGGTNTVTVYRKGGITPFNQFDFPNSQCRTVFGYGSQLDAYVDLYASSAHNSTTVTIVGTSGKVFNLTSSGSGLIFETDSYGNHDVTFIGNVTLGSMVLTINVAIMSQTVDMGEVFFPVSYLYDIFVGDGKTQTTVTASAKYKFLPGSSMTIAENATLVTSGEVIFYKDFADSVEGFSSSAAPTYPSGYAAASLSVAGTLRITGGKFGAEIAGASAGARIEISSGASINALSKEGHSGDTSSAEAILNLGKFVNVYTANVTSSFKETGSAAISPGANYSFDGSKWNKV